MRLHRSTLVTAGIVVAVLALAEFLLPRTGVPVYMVPTPSAILQSIRENVGVMVGALAITLGEAMVGLLLRPGPQFSPRDRHVVPTPRAALKLVNGFGVACQSTPLLAVAPLLTLWFGHSYLSKAVAAMIVCFFPLLTGWLTGFRSISQEQLQLFENMDATRVQAARRLYVPPRPPVFPSGPARIDAAGIARRDCCRVCRRGRGPRLPDPPEFILPQDADDVRLIIISTLTGWLLTLLVGAIEQRVLFWRNGADAT